MQAAAVRRFMSGAPAAMSGAVLRSLAPQDAGIRTVEGFRS